MTRKKKMKIKRIELSKYLSELFDLNKYTIGFYNIDHYNLTNFTLPTDDIRVNDEIEKLTHSILCDGIILKDKTIIESITFENDLDKLNFIDYYNYGNTQDYIIIAIPKFLKKANEEEIYIGSPTNIKNKKYSSLCDLIIPKINENIQKIDSMFILSSIHIIDMNSSLSNQMITVTLNDKHISNNEDKVDEKYFEDRKKIIKKINDKFGVNFIKQEYSQTQKFIECYNKLEKLYNMNKLNLRLNLLYINVKNHNFLKEKFKYKNMLKLNEMIEVIYKTFNQAKNEINI